MSTEGLVYESVVDFAADSPRRGLLNPPRGADGEVVRPRPAPETTRERCAQVRVRPRFGVGRRCAGGVRKPPTPSCRNPYRMVTEVAGRTTMAASFSMPGEGEPIIPVVFPARSTGIGIANRQARRRRARTGAQIFPRQSSGRGAPRSRRRRGCGARRALRARGCGPVHSPLRAGGEGGGVRPLV